MINIAVLISNLTRRMADVFRRGPADQARRGQAEVRRSRLYILCLLSLAATVSGCAETAFMAHTAKQAGSYGGTGPGGSDMAGWRGDYRIGKPYQISGQWYYPAEDFDYDEVGIASWYGTGFHGKPTASGETFDENALTAAHPTLPMPTIVRVVNLENGRALTLRINDRGPFSGRRIIDVSRRAAELLGFRSKGLAKVRVTVLAEESLELKRRAGGEPRSASAGRNGAPDGPSGTWSAQNTRAVSAQPLETGGGEFLSGGRPAIYQEGYSAASYEERGDGRDGGIEPLFVQAGAFVSLDNARQFSGRVSAYGPVQVLQSDRYAQSVYRVRLGPFSSGADAAEVRASLVDAGVYDAHLVFQ